MDTNSYASLVDVPRRAWDPTEGAHSRTNERGLSDITGLEIHWDGSGGDLTDHGDTATELLSFERFHEQSKGWYDLFYNLGADSEGNIYEGRDITIPSQGSLYSWATMLCVTGTNAITPEEELVFARSIFRAWTAVDPSRSRFSLRVHGERGSTSCPGPQLTNIVNRLRDGWIPEGINIMTTPQDFLFENLGGLDDAKNAKANGFWNGSDPAMAASRSVVAVVAQRAYEKAVEDAIKSAAVEGPRGPKGPKGDPGPKGDSASIPLADIQAAIRAEMPAIVRAVKDELARDLSD